MQISLQNGIMISLQILPFIISSYISVCYSNLMNAIVSAENVLTCYFCDAVDQITIVESLQFDFGTIRAATNNFSDANKFGRGGFGVVYTL